MRRSIAPSVPLAALSVALVSIGCSTARCSIGVATLQQADTVRRDFLVAGGIVSQAVGAVLWDPGSTTVMVLGRNGKKQVTLPTIQGEIVGGITNAEGKVILLRRDPLSILVLDSSGTGERIPIQGDSLIGVRALSIPSERGWIVVTTVAFPGSDAGLSRLPLPNRWYLRFYKLSIGADAHLSFMGATAVDSTLTGGPIVGALLGERLVFMQRDAPEVLRLYDFSGGVGTPVTSTMTVADKVFVGHQNAKAVSMHGLGSGVLVTYADPVRADVWSVGLINVSGTMAMPLSLPGLSVLGVSSEQDQILMLRPGRISELLTYRWEACSTNLKEDQS